MEISKATGSLISESEAISMTKRFRDSQGSKKNYVKAHLFGSDVLQKLLDQNGSIGLRFYYGLDEMNDPCLVVAAVDENGEDIMKLYGDKSLNCPPMCSTSKLSE